MKKKTKKRTLIFLTILTLMVAIMTALSIFTPVLGEVAGGGNGDNYYEYRCLDVSSYKAQGYTFNKYDEHGCEIVGKSIYSGTSMLYEGQECACYKGCSGGSSNCLNIGSNWQRIACDGISAICGLYIMDYKGGYERVMNTCQFDQNDLLGAESFIGGQTITKFSTRYPIKGFCKAHPAIFTDDAKKESITSTIVYDKLINGESVAIPTGQTLTLFYILENNYYLPTKCTSSNNLAIDLNNTNICKSTLGFTYICSVGQFDWASGTCVVQPDSSLKCEKGRYDTLTDKCIYNPPIQVDCGADKYYSIVKDACIETPMTKYECPEGFMLSQPKTQQECNGVWYECPQCPKDKVCPSGTCIPQCSIGQTCVLNPSIILGSLHCIEITSSGICIQSDGEEIEICGSNMDWDNGLKACIMNPTTKLICKDGSMPVKNTLTGVLECLSEVSKYISCPVGEVYDMTQGKCVGQISVYDQKTGNFITYRMLDIDCKSDADCSPYGDDLSCNPDDGVCYSNLFTNTVFVDKTVFVNNGNGMGLGWLSITGLVAIGLLLFIMLIIAVL